MQTKGNNLAHIFGGIGALLPAAAFAQTVQPLGGGGTGTLCTIINNLFSLVGVFGTIVLIIALAVILYAAFLFVTSGGNEEQTKQGRTFLLYGLIGLAVAFLAIFADEIITELFPVTGGASFIGQCTSIQPFN